MTNTRPGCFEVASVHVALRVARQARAADARPAPGRRLLSALVQRIRQAMKVTARA